MISTQFLFIRCRCMAQDIKCDEVREHIPMFIFRFNEDRVHVVERRSDLASSFSSHEHKPVVYTSDQSFVVIVSIYIVHIRHTRIFMFFVQLYRCPIRVSHTWLAFSRFLCFDSLCTYLFTFFYFILCTDLLAHVCSFRRKRHEKRTTRGERKNVNLSDFHFYIFPYFVVVVVSIVIFCVFIQLSTSYVSRVEFSTYILHLM